MEKRKNKLLLAIVFLLVSTAVLSLVLPALASAAGGSTDDGTVKTETVAEADYLSVSFTSEGKLQIMVDADQLSTMIENKQVSAEDLKGFLPEILVSLVKERDKEEIVDFLITLLESPAAVDFIPWEILGDYITPNKLFDLLTAEELKACLDLEALVGLVDREAIDDIMKDDAEWKDLCNNLWNALTDNGQDTDAIMTALDLDLNRILKSLTPKERETLALGLLDQYSYEIFNIIDMHALIENLRAEQSDDPATPTAFEKLWSELLDHHIGEITAVVDFDDVFEKLDAEDKTRLWDFLTKNCQDEIQAVVSVDRILHMLTGEEKAKLWGTVTDTDKPYFEKLQTVSIDYQRIYGELTKAEKAALEEAKFSFTKPDALFDPDVISQTRVLALLNETEWYAVCDLLLGENGDATAVFKALDYDFEHMLTEDDRVALWDAVIADKTADVIKAIGEDRIMQLVETDELVIAWNRILASDKDAATTWLGCMNDDDRLLIADLLAKEEGPLEQLWQIAVTDDSDVLLDVMPHERLLKSLSEDEWRRLWSMLSDEHLEATVEHVGVERLTQLIPREALWSSLDVSAFVRDMDRSVLAEMARPIALDFFLGEVESIRLNDYLIYDDYDAEEDYRLSLQALQTALVHLLPDTLDSIRQSVKPGSDGIFAEIELSTELRGKTYALGVVFGFTGDATKLESYVDRALDNVIVNVGDDNALDIRLIAPAQLADVFVRAVDFSRIPDSLKEKVFSLTDATAKEAVEEVLGSLTVAEIRQILDAVDGEKLDNAIAQLGSVGDKIDDLMNSDDARLADLLERTVEKATKLLELLPAKLMDKKLSDFYLGNGEFLFEGEFTGDLYELAASKTDRVTVLKDYVTDTEITQKFTFSLVMTDFYRVTYVADNQTDNSYLYSTFLPVGADLTMLNGISQLAGYGTEGWCDADGNLVTAMPAADTVLFGEGSHVVFMVDGAVVATVPYRVGDTSVDEPALPPRDGYTAVSWEPYADKLTGGNIIVQGQYVPIEYTVTFVSWDGTPVGYCQYHTGDTTLTNVPAVPDREDYENGRWEEFAHRLTRGDGNFTVKPLYDPMSYTVRFMTFDGATVVAERTYKMGDSKVDNIPNVPAREHYENGKWGSYELKGGDVVVLPEYTPVTYTLTFMADGKQVGALVKYNVRDGLLETAPTVPAKKHYDGQWLLDAFDKTLGGAQTIEAAYSLKQYTLTFVYDDESGEVTRTVLYTIESKKSDLDNKINDLIVEDKALPDAVKHYLTGWEGIDITWDDKDTAIAAALTDKMYKDLILHGEDRVIAQEAEAKTYYITLPSGEKIPYNVETKFEDLPLGAPPERKHYTRKWKPIDCTQGGDLVLENSTEYYEETPITYYLRFEIKLSTMPISLFALGDEETVLVEIPYTVEDANDPKAVFDAYVSEWLYDNGVGLPEAKDFYTASWSGLIVDELENGVIKKAKLTDEFYNDLLVNESTLGYSRDMEPVYTPIAYELVFVKRDGTEVTFEKQPTYNVDMTKEQLLAVLAGVSVPEELHYNQDGYWAMAFGTDTEKKPIFANASTLAEGLYDYFVTNGGEKKIYAVGYTPTQYTLTFKNENGSTLTGGTFTYTIDTLTGLYDRIKDVAVPDKNFYSGKWVVKINEGKSDEATVPLFVDGALNPAAVTDIKSGAGTKTVTPSYDKKTYQLILTVVQANTVDVETSFVIEYDVSTAEAQLKEKIEAKMASIVAGGHLVTAHYTGAWAPWSDGKNAAFDQQNKIDAGLLADIVANRGNREFTYSFTANSYKLTFKKPDGTTLREVSYTVNTTNTALYDSIKDIKAPLPPAHYNNDGVWMVVVDAQNGTKMPLLKDGALNQELAALLFANGGDQEIVPVYTATNYQLHFFVNGDVLDTVVNYTVESKLEDLDIPDVPDHPHYLEKAWSTISLTGGSQDIHAIYSNPRTYTLTFKDQDGNVLENLQLDYTVESTKQALDALMKAIKVPSVTHKDGQWIILIDEESTPVNDAEGGLTEALYEYLTENGGNRDIQATYTWTLYELHVGDKVFHYTVEDTLEDLFERLGDDIPAASDVAPKKEHYEAAWKKTVDLSLGGKVVLEYEYLPITYYFTFYVGDKQIGDPVAYNVDGLLGDAPTVPIKLYYDGSWNLDSIDLKLGGNRDIQAVYTPTTYYLTFYADGKQVGEPIAFNVKDGLLAELPAVPEKEGYIGEWPADLELTVGGNKEIHAVYKQASGSDPVEPGDTEEKGPGLLRLILWILLVITLVAVILLIVLRRGKDDDEGDHTPPPVTEEPEPTPPEEIEEVAAPVVIPPVEEPGEEEVDEERETFEDAAILVRTEGKKSFVNISVLENHFEAGDEVTLATLKEKQLVPKRAKRLKVIGRIGLTKALRVSAHAYSAGAKEAITRVGGEINRIH